jgi:hypothetical protein
MTRNSERACWIIALLLVAAVAVSRGSRDAAAPAEATEHARSRAPGEGGRFSSAERGTADLRPGRDDRELRQLADHALSTANRTERYQRLMQMLDRTTKDNWQTLWHEYIRQTLEEGRVHEHEWSLFMNRVGELAGPEAMEYFTHNGQNEHTFNRREVLIGWATADPRGAHEWLTSQPVENQPREFWGALVQGASARDATLALTWLGEVPPAHAPAVTRHAVESLIQAEGIANTSAALQKMVETSGGTPPPHLRMFFEELKARASRMEWLSQAYPDVNHRAPDLAELEAAFGSP